MPAVRRLRAACVLAALWGFAWLIGGLALSYYRVRTGGYEFHYIRSTGDFVRTLALFAAAWGVIGVLNGFAFAGVLTSLGRRTSPHERRTGKVAWWGVVAGLVLPMLYLGILAIQLGGDVPVSGAVLILGGGAGLGAVCALATLALAGGA